MAFLKRSDWFRRAFGRDYLLLYAHRDDREAERQVRLMARTVPFAPGQRVLDVACGAGRHVLAMARFGARATGVDLSATLLGEARRRLARAGAGATLVRADMRRLPSAWRGRFDGAVSFFTSLGYFDSAAEDLAVLRGIRRALKPGGWFWIDLVNGERVRRRFDPGGKRTLRAGRRRLRIEERRWFSGPFLWKRTAIEERGRRRVHLERVRLYSPASFRSLLSRAGLVVTGAFGDDAGAPLAEDSPRMLWHGRRPYSRRER